MLGAAKEESKDTKPVNSATVIPPFTASHALAQEVENLGLLKRGGIVGMMMMMMMMMMMLMMMMMMMREKNMYIYIHIHPNVKLSAFPETTYKLHGTLRIQEVSAVSAKKKSNTAWRRYSKHVIIYVFKPWFLPVYKFKTAWWRMVKKKSETSGIYQ